MTLELLDPRSTESAARDGTAVTDRWALAILENFKGDVPDVLEQYGAPATINPN